VEEFRVGRLDGKVVWVTGGGSGIGEAAALALAGEGATIVLTGRREVPLEEVAGRIRRRRRRHPCPARRSDAARRGCAASAISSATRSAASTSLCNNAGLNINDRHWDKLTPGKTPR